MAQEPASKHSSATAGGLVGCCCCSQLLTVASTTTILSPSTKLTVKRIRKRLLYDKVYMRTRCSYTQGYGRVTTRRKLYRANVREGTQMAGRCFSVERVAAKHHNHHHNNTNHQESIFSQEPQHHSVLDLWTTTTTFCCCINNARDYSSIKQTPRQRFKSSP